METELSQCELTERNALSCSHPGYFRGICFYKRCASPSSLQRSPVGAHSYMGGESQATRGIGASHLYPNSESLYHWLTVFTNRTHEIDIEKIVHRNQVAFSHNRHLIVPVMAEQTRVRYQTYIRLTRKQKKKQDRWNATHRDDDDSPSGRWKDDSDSKREKRSFRTSFYPFPPPARTMARITRSQTSNMVECESLTPHVPKIPPISPRIPPTSPRAKRTFPTDIAVPRGTKYVTHNAKLTLDGKPMKCQDLPRGG